MSQSNAGLDKKDRHMLELTVQERHALPADLFAGLVQRKEPLKNADHFRCVPARFDLVQGVTDDEHDEAWRRIEAAADANTACSCACPEPDAETTKNQAAFLTQVCQLLAHFWSAPPANPHGCWVPVPK